VILQGSQYLPSLYSFEHAGALSEFPPEEGMDARGVVWGLKSESNPNEGHPEEHLGIGSNQPE
jgi:hypothetical protein